MAWADGLATTNIKINEHLYNIHPLSDVLLPLKARHFVRSCTKPNPHVWHSHLGVHDDAASMSVPEPDRILKNPSQEKVEVQ